MSIQTRLIKKSAKSQKVCTTCKNLINKGDVYHLEEGVDQHLHSLLARRFCTKCYAKFGEKKLISGPK